MSKKWTVNDMPDLTGNVVIVTGGNSGIGFEAAKEFVRKGAQTILACRSMEKGQAAVDAIKAEIPNGDVTLMRLDLADLSSVQMFAAAFNEQYDRLDVLANNAGIMMVPYGKTVDGFERQFGTNHLGHFALTGLLLKRLIETPGARVVNVSSSGHRMGNVDFDNLMYDGGKGYSPAPAYGRSKLANLLFTYELQRRFEAAGIDAAALAAHPGASNTNLGNHLMERWYMRMLFGVFERFMMQGADMGALPTVRAAVDPEARGGMYYGPAGLMEMAGSPVIVSSNAASHNAADAQKLWEMSEELTGVQYQFRAEKTGS